MKKVVLTIVALILAVVFMYYWQQDDIVGYSEHGIPILVSDLKEN